MADDLQSVEESTFDKDEVQALVEENLDFLKDTPFDEDKVPHWIDQICESTMRSLVDLQKPFKYIVTCAIVQKNGAGVQTANSLYWDVTTDELVCVKWPDEKHKDFNKTLYVFVTVYGLGL